MLDERHLIYFLHEARHSRLSQSRTVDLSINRRHAQCQAIVTALCMQQVLQMRIRNSISGAPPPRLAAGGLHCTMTAQRRFLAVNK